MKRIKLISNFTCPSCLLSLCHAALPIPQASVFLLLCLFACFAALPIPQASVCHVSVCHEQSRLGSRGHVRGKFLTGKPKENNRSGTTPYAVNNL